MNTVHLDHLKLQLLYRYLGMCYSSAYSLQMTEIFSPFQRYIHVILVIVAIICIPWMLCIKPFYLLYKHKRIQVC